jgi:hypothetical protein
MINNPRICPPPLTQPKPQAPWFNRDVPPAEYEQAHYAALTPRCSPYESDTKPGTLHLVTNQVTLALGRTNFSNAVWQASKPKPAAIPA